MVANSDWVEELPDDNFLELPAEEEPTPEEGEFDALTRLYIRTNPADTGAEPLAAGLEFWLSPDIKIRKPDGTLGIEATAGMENQIEVTVHNDGGLPASDAYVDVFLDPPAAGMSPASAILLAGGYMIVPPYGYDTIGFKWTPPTGQATHRCLIARVSSVAPPDTYTDPTVFDVIGDRHVAQRNVHVVTLAKDQGEFQFLFQFANTLRGTGRFRLRVEDTSPEMRTLVLREALGREAEEITLRPVQKTILRIGKPISAPRREMSLEEDQQTSKVDKAGKQSDDEQVRMEPGEVRQGMITIFRTPETQPGDVNVFNIVQVDRASHQPVGGYTLVVRFE